jgi:hypothetical protein
MTQTANIDPETFKPANERVRELGWLPRLTVCRMPAISPSVEMAVGRVVLLDPDRPSG